MTASKAKNAVRRFLDLSTAHASKAVEEWLDDQAAKNARKSPSAKCVVAAHEYGWFFHAGRGVETYPEELWDIIEYAKKNDCDYVNFDRDASIIDELTVFEEID